MKPITINAFEITELSDKARERAYHKWLDGYEYFCADDNRASLLAFEKSFPVKIRDWSYGGRGEGVSWDFTKDDDIEELSGHRLATYLWNNFSDVLYQRKYKTSFKRKGKINHRMITQKLCKDRTTGEEYYWTKVTSNIFVETYNCPLTGYCIDNSLLDPMWKFMDKPDGRTFKELIDDCFEEWVKDCNTDYEYSSSEEFFIEECASQDWSFDEGGRIL